MASRNDYSPRRSGNNRHAPIPASRQYNTADRVSSHHQDSNDKRRSVPGLVSDPNDRLTGVDKAIQRGQQDSTQRLQGQTHLGENPNNNHTSFLEDRSSLPTITQPYYRPSFFRDSHSVKKKPFINPGLLSFLPGLTGCALLITAVVLTNWSITTETGPSIYKVTYRGLFRVCTEFPQRSVEVNVTCEAWNEIADNSLVFHRLEQATRGLVIIAAAVAAIAVVVCCFLGIRKWERKRGTIISGCLFALAGASAGGGMGCFTASLLDAMHFSPQTTVVFAGSSFYFGWGGAGCLIIATVTSYMAHCAGPK